MFFESTISILVGACGATHCSVAQQANMFTSKLIIYVFRMMGTLKVFDDFSSDAYKELFELFTSSGDWVVNI